MLGVRGEVSGDERLVGLEPVLQRCGDFAAVREAEGAEDSAEFVGGFAGAGASFGVVRVGDEDLVGDAKDVDAFEDDGTAGAPKRGEFRGECGGEVGHEWVRSYSSFQPRAWAISPARVSGSKGLNMTAATPRSEKRF